MNKTNYSQRYVIKKTIININFFLLKIQKSNRLNIKLINY